MKNTIIYGLRQLCGVVAPEVERLAGKEMTDGFGIIDDAFIEIDNAAGTIADFGPVSALDSARLEGADVIRGNGRVLVPAFADSHTHIVYAGSREGEFVDKINGLSYEEIAARGGGILNSADRLHEASDDELFYQAQQRLSEIAAKGTAAVEIKSGYGLNTADELRMLRVIARLKESSPLDIRATFLGAHAVGREYAGRQEEYVDMLVREMLPAVAAEGLADYVDVFCDRGFFTVEQTDRILSEAARYGLRPKIHANELDNSGGVQVGVARNAVSVDHLERMGGAEIELLAASDTIATMLPGASFFLGMPFAPARIAVNSGLTVALASDYNPGSSPSGDMRFVWALGCIKMKLSPVEALAACTVNGAAAMGLAGTVGSIAKGRPATFILSRPVPSLDFIPYAYTTPWIEKIFIRGREM
ncbi:MAG: imidazolonepropionase [Muribaculaceae bacterium]|nr:imidazolonepropionase [Muribaculaceae bacterium]